MTLKLIARNLVLLALLPLITWCGAVPLTSSPRLNEIQVLGSHNSYKQAIDPTLLTQLAADNAALAASLDYDHVPLSAQLDHGLRKLELDVFYDPEGGRYATPLGLTAVPDASPYDGTRMLEPGFKVLHVQDIDFRSHCQTFRLCLKEIKDWSDANAGHVPLFVTINAKDDVIDRPGFVRPLKFNTSAWQQLDDEIRDVMGDSLLTPDDVRGDADTLREAVLDGWPRIDRIRGRILFVLDDATAKKQAYIKDHPSLAGRVMFVDVPEDTPEAAIRIINDPVQRLSYIQDLVRQGFIVRTRADADTREARSGDRSRFNAALRSGAQIISTDYYKPDEKFGHGYVVSLPGRVVAHCNPLLVAQPCTLSE